MCCWGKLLSINDTSGKNVGAINPFRYRGYYYDTETGLYYLQSRYYDPNTGRFLNADDEDTLTATPMGLTDKNLYSYCDNNPVMRADEGGHFWNIVIGAAAGAFCGFVSQVVSNVISGNTWYDGIAGAIVGGAVGGAILAATGNIAASSYASAAAEAVTNEALSYRHKKLTRHNLKASALRIARNTAINGSIYYFTGKFAAKRVKINKGWFKAKKFRTALFGKTAIRNYKQYAISSFFNSSINGARNNRRMRSYAYR